MFKKTLIAAALAVAATGSFAQVYVQGAIGQGTVSVDATNTYSIKKSSSGNKLAIGYELGNGWAIEGMIISYGKATATHTSNATSDLKASGTAIGGVYSADLGDGHGLKAGLYYGSNKADRSASSFTTAASESKGQLNLGLGYSYSFNKNAAFTVDYDSSKVTMGTASSSVSLLSFGVRFKF